jgi:hypothetical protein
MMLRFLTLLCVISGGISSSPPVCSRIDGVVSALAVQVSAELGLPGISALPASAPSIFGVDRQRVVAVPVVFVEVSARWNEVEKDDNEEDNTDEESGSHFAFFTTYRIQSGLSSAEKQSATASFVIRPRPISNIPLRC